MAKLFDRHLAFCDLFIKIGIKLTKGRANLHNKYIICLHYITCDFGARISGASVTMYRAGGGCNLRPPSTPLNQINQIGARQAWAFILVLDSLSSRNTHTPPSVRIRTHKKCRAESHSLPRARNYTTIVRTLINGFFTCKRGTQLAAPKYNLSQPLLSR